VPLVSCLPSIDHETCDEPVALPTRWWSGGSDRFLITQELDFSDRRRFAAGTHAGALLVRLPDAEQWRIADYLVAWFSTPDANTWDRCFVVATPNKVRVLRPLKP